MGRKGLNIDGQNLTNLRFADDLTIREKLKQYCKDYRKYVLRSVYKLTRQKQFMTNLVPSGNINIGNCEIERVDKYNIIFWSCNTDLEG